MSSREAIISGFYDQADEDGRLRRSRNGQLELRHDFSLSDDDFAALAAWF